MTTWLGRHKCWSRWVLGEQCPVVPGLKRDDWPLEDPKGKPVERVREIRTTCVSESGPC